MRRAPPKRDGAKERRGATQHVSPLIKGTSILKPLAIQRGSIPACSRPNNLRRCQGSGMRISEKGTARQQNGGAEPIRLCPRRRLQTASAGFSFSHNRLRCMAPAAYRARGGGARFLSRPTRGRARSSSSCPSVWVRAGPNRLHSSFSFLSRCGYCLWGSSGSCCS